MCFARLPLSKNMFTDDVGTAQCTPPLTYTYLTWPIISFTLGQMRLLVVVVGGSTKISVSSRRRLSLRLKG